VVLTKALDVAVGDQAGGEAEEGFVDVVASFPSDAQAAEAVQPGDGALNHIAENAAAVEAGFWTAGRPGRRACPTLTGLPGDYRTGLARRRAQDDAPPRLLWEGASSSPADLLCPSAAYGLRVAPTAPVRVVDADLVPGLAALEPGQGVHPDRDGDALHVVGERLEAIVEQVLLLARQDDVQPREGRATDGIR
jgi:hypothetical protein